MKSFQDVLWARRWIVLAVIVIAACCFKPLKAFTVPSYTATAEISYVGHAPDAVILPPDLPDLALSENVLERAVQIGHLPLSAEALGDKATVRVSPHSDIIPVSFKSHDADLAARGANALADATIYEYKKLSTRQYDEVASALEAQLKKLNQEVSASDGQLRVASETDPLAEINTGLDSLTLRLDSIDQARSTAQAKLSQDLAATPATTTDSQVNSVIQQEAIAHDPAALALSAQQAKDLAELEATRAGYTDNYPGLAGLDDKVRKETAATQRESTRAATSMQAASPTFATMLTSQVAARSLVAGDRAQVAALDTEYNNLRGRVRSLSQSSLPADDARVARDSAIASAAQIASRLQNTLADKEQASSLNSVVVLDHANDVTPSLSPIVALATIIIAVLGLAIGAAYLSEIIDPRIRERADVEKIYDAPLLGSL